jgi:chloride channel 7
MNEKTLYNPNVNSNLENQRAPHLLTISQPLKSNPTTNYESLDYDVIENVLYQKEVIAKTHQFFRKRDIARWAICFLIAVSVAVLAWAVDMGVRNVSFLKFFLANQVTDWCDNCFWAPFLTYMASNVILVSVASALVVWIEPLAGGSGIPEIKCYLNGIKIPHVIRFKTLACKVVGTLCSVSSGLTVGQEGPMIHTGAIVAGGICQGKSTTFRWLDTGLFKYFRNDHEKRDFVSSGAAAGVAAAFGAPVGGVLFALEEGASFWNQPLTWRIFFTSVVATFMFKFLSSWTDRQPGSMGLVNFGTFSKQRNHGYSLVHFPFFILVGVMGGLLGALFNHVFSKMTQIRMRYIRHPILRFLEALLSAVITSTCSFLLSYFVHNCRRLHPGEVSDEGTDIRHFQFFCPNGYYNDMATIFYTTEESAIKQLLHSESDFSVATLFVFSVVYFALFCWTQGMAVPAGVFVPSIVAGSAYGRLVGQLLYHWTPFRNGEWRINPGTFALIGAASLLGGVTRMTISLTVILIESTNDTTYGLPLMVTLMVAKWTGDLFNHGMYEITINLRKIPFLHYEPPFYLRKLTAQHIMRASNVVSFHCIERVGTIYRTLRSTTHNGFPIVDADGTFMGLILRSQLIVLLKKKAFSKSAESIKNFYQLLTLDDFQLEYPRYPPIDTVSLTAEEEMLYIDLAPYMNRTPFIVRDNSSLSRVYTLFRTMGLRHLVVVNQSNSVVGIITRKDLVSLPKPKNLNHISLL